MAQINLHLTHTLSLVLYQHTRLLLLLIQPMCDCRYPCRSLYCAPIMRPSLVLKTPLMDIVEWSVTYVYPCSSWQSCFDTITQNYNQFTFGGVILSFTFHPCAISVGSERGQSIAIYQQKRSGERGSSDFCIYENQLVIIEPNYITETFNN